MKQHPGKVRLLSLAVLIVMFPKTSLAETCRTLSVSSPVSYITNPIGTSNTHIAERMQSGHIYPTRLQVLRALAAKTGRRVDRVNPLAGFLNYRVTCHILKRTYSRSQRRVSYKYRCFARGRYCHFNRGATGRVRPRPWRP